MTEESIKITPEECEDLTLKFLPQYIERANQGDVWAQYRLYDIWRACLDANPSRQPPLELAKWIDYVLVECVLNNKKPHQVVKFFKRLISGAKTTIEREEYLKEKDFMLAAHVELLCDEGMSKESAIMETADVFKERYPIGASVDSIKKACKKMKNKKAKID